MFFVTKLYANRPDYCYFLLQSSEVTYNVSSGSLSVAAAAVSICSDIGRLIQLFARR